MFPPKLGRPRKRAAFLLSGDSLTFMLKRSMRDQFQANATVISLLHDHIANLSANYERLVRQYRGLQDAQYFMGKLVETIVAHPALLLEWDNFRERAGLEPHSMEVPRAARFHYDNFIVDEAHHAPPICVVDKTAPDRLVRAQGTVIADLKERAATYQSGIERLTDRIAASTSAHYYMDMQRCIQADPLVLDAWKTFLMLITLTVDGPIQGITCDDHSRRHF